MASDLSTLKEAVSYPWDGGNAGVTLVIGGILTLLSPLVVPGLFVLGYGLRVVEAVLEGRPAPPRFDDWGALFREGLKAAVVLVLYVVVPLGIGVVVLAAVTGMAGFRFDGPLLISRPLAAGGVAVVVALLLAALVLVVSYVTPVALLILARTRRLEAAFVYADVKRLAGSDAYGAAWLLALAVFAAAGVVLTVLYAASIGVVVSGFVTFYAFVAMVYLYAQGAEAAGIEQVAEPAVEDAEDGDEDGDDETE